MAQSPKAIETCIEEWNTLDQINCWYVKAVISWQEVRRKAQGLIHIGSLHEICVLKGSEVDENDPTRKYKGRVVCLGDWVKDQAGEVAAFRTVSFFPRRAGGVKDLRRVW